jgi:hypothetical protein
VGHLKGEPEWRMADSQLSGKSRDLGWELVMKKNRTIYMRPEIVTQGLLTKGYSWEVNPIGALITTGYDIPFVTVNPSCFFPSFISLRMVFFSIRTVYYLFGLWICFVR